MKEAREAGETGGCLAAGEDGRGQKTPRPASRNAGELRPNRRPWVWPKGELIPPYWPPTQSRNILPPL